MTTRPFPEVEGVTHRFVEANGLRFHVAEAPGPPDATQDPVLMLHGWPQHWYVWRDVIPRFADHRRVICADLRGLGWSDAPRSGYDKETLAADVVALLDAMQVERVDLMGHDWGGWIGFLLGLDHPERIRRFVALNIAHPWPRFDPLGFLSLWRLWYMGLFSLPVLGPRAMRRWGNENGTIHRRTDIPGWGDVERATFLGQFVEPERAHATAQIYRSFLAIDLPRALKGRYRRGRLTPPTLLLVGADDPVMRPRQLAGFEPYADDMRLELVPGIGHFIVDEVPDLVADRALAHFAG